MKNSILYIRVIIVIIGILLVTASKTQADTPTPTQANSLEQQINSLKDRIASRVAQLNLVEKKGIIGTVSDTSETQLTIIDSQGNPRIIDVDELTNFSSPSAKSSFGISDITKGMTIGTIGLYNKDSRHLLARWVDVLSLPKIYMGGILSIDKDNFTLSIATVDTNETTIEIEDITKTLSYTKEGGMLKSGFSKLQVGQRVLVVGFSEVQDSTKIIASRVVAFPELPVDPKIPLVKPEDIAPVTPSTGSGKKLTPLTR